MKKLYALLVVVFIGFVGKAQIVNIPDANLKTILLLASTTNPIASTQTPDANGIITTWVNIDTNYDGEIQVSEALAIKSLRVEGYNSITDFTGIQSFTELVYLNCSSNYLPSLDISGLTNLLYLNCSNNQIPSLNVSGLTNLKILRCSYNQLTSIDVSNLLNLQEFYCDQNLIPSLNVSGLTNLKKLDCSFSPFLSSLNVSGLTNLQTLDCHDAQLLSIDLSGLTNLQFLNLDVNQLSTLDVSGLINLQILICSQNQIPSLNVSGLTNLQGLDCSDGQLSSLNVSGLINLQSIECSHNQLQSLNVSGLTNISTLYCHDNQLISLDVSSMTNLHTFYCYNNQLNTLFIKNGSIENDIDFSSNPSLEYICADENQISQVQNLITQYGYSNCHVNSYCSFTPGGTFYTIQGNNRYDSNNNGCDVSDNNIPNLKLSFSDGTATSNLIPDTTGAYRYDVQASTQTFSPLFENPTYFTVSPVSASVTFPSTTSPYFQDFCITATGSHNDLEVALIPLGISRPGFDATYKIIYKNKGTATQSGTLNLAFDDSRLDYVSATPTVSSQATNSLSWSFSNLLPFETREILVTINVNSPTETPAVNAGDVLNYTATVTGATDETPADNTSTLNQTVVNALDPNDKTCVEGTTISPSMIGQYVHYIIGFENDGTANAQNIVVKDMIDAAKFDISSLVPLGGSASYTTRITNTNQVEFIFQNINLPFASGTNTGYVAFKIKTKPTLVVGDIFSNSANIYFDYNAPIVTNTYTTTITALGTQDFDFGSVFSLSPVPAKNSLTITTKQDVMMRSVSIYNTLGQLVQVNTNPNETIDVSGLQSGSYFIRITSDKGSASGKFIKE